MKSKKSKKMKNIWVKVLLLAFGVFVAIVILSQFLLKPKETHNISETPTPSSLPEVTQQTITPTPISEKHGWKIYKNNTYNFSFDYPDYLTRLEDNLPKIPNGSSTSQLRISSNDYKYDLQVYINPQFGGMCNPTWKYELKKGVSFTKTEGASNDNLPGGSGGCSSFFTANISLDNQTKLLVTFAYDKNYSNAQSDFEKMLSTFTFPN